MSGYDWNETPASRRQNRFHEISEGFNSGSLSGLLDRIRRPRGGGDSQGLLGGVVDTLKDAPRVFSEHFGWNEEEKYEADPRWMEYDRRDDELCRQQLENMPADEWKMLNEYIDANPSATRALQEAAKNSDWSSFLYELRDLRSALGMEGQDGFGRQ